MIEWRKTGIESSSIIGMRWNSTIVEQPQEERPHAKKI